MDARNTTMGVATGVATTEDTKNNSQRPMGCQKRGYTHRLKNINGQRRNRQVRRKIQGVEASKTLIEGRLKRKHPTDLTKEIK